MVVGRRHEPERGAGEKAVGGGFAGSGGFPLMISSAPTADGGGWTVLLFNVSDSEAASGSVQAVCVK